MPLAHREDDLRVCGAKTVVKGQSTVRINGKLWAVKDDPNDHLDGELINSISSVKINGKEIIVNKPDLAKVDRVGHPPSLTKTATACNSVKVG